MLYTIISTMREIEINSDVLPQVRDPWIEAWTKARRNCEKSSEDPRKGRFKELYSFFEYYDKWGEFLVHSSLKSSNFNLFC